MALPVLQHQTITGTATTTPVNAVFSVTPASGNLIVQQYTIFGSTAGSTQSSSTNGNALTVIDTYNPAASTRAVGAFQKTFGGSDTSTFALADSTSPSVLRTDATEWSNLTSTTDGTTTKSNGTSSTSAALGSITTTAANSVIFVVGGWTTATSASSINASFTVINNANSRYFTAYLIATTAGTYSPTVSWTGSVTYTFMMFALQASGSTPTTNSGFFGLM